MVTAWIGDDRQHQTLLAACLLPLAPSPRDPTAACAVKMLFQKFPAREHAQKLAISLFDRLEKQQRESTHAVFLQAPPVECRHDTDRELPFHQEANFTYLTGYPHADASVLVIIKPSDGAPTIEHTLFVPPALPEVTMWSVRPPTLEEARAGFDTDSVRSTADLGKTLEMLGPDVRLHTLPMTKEYPALPDTVLSAKTLQPDTSHLLDALHIARLTKSNFEIELVREANRISSGAHEVVMRELGKYARKRKEGQGKEKERTGKEGLSEWEVEGEADAEAVFVAACRRQGSSPAYLPICASGSRASTLHYVCNDRIFPHLAEPRQNGDKSFRRALQQGCCSSDTHEAYTAGTPIGEYHSDSFEPQVLLIDAGGEWQNYASDITRTVPVGNGGKFTKEAGEIYELVLRMQKESEAMVKPGVHWDSIHLHSHRVLVDGLLKLGIVKGYPESILQSGVTCAFYPHGLGHSLGLDVHDSRQYLRSTQTDLPESSKQTPAKLYTYLRIRQPLQEGMILTVEPGCYFPAQLMEEHGVWKSEYVDQEVLKRYIPVGGVRIEDAVVVRKDGMENLTTAPRKRQEVEALCSGEL